MIFRIWAEIQPGLKFFARNRKSRFILYLQGPRAEISSRFAGLKLHPAR